MDRREFLKKSAALGVGAGLLFLPKGLRGLSRLAAAASYPDLVAVRGGTPETMFDRGIKSIGGMSRFVKHGQKVLLKPNISWDSLPDGAANTSPGLVATVVKHCLDAGASKVVVMDHSIEYWKNSLQNSGVHAAATGAGAIYAPAESERYYQNVAVNGLRLKEAMIHEAVLECDVLISVPVLKHHGGAGVSIAAKNLMGCVWNRRTYHSNSLQSCIADFLLARKPDLCIVDANRVITKNGPRGGSPSDIVEMNSLLISQDVVAIDTAASMMLGRKPGEIEHIRLAAEAGFGRMDLSQLNIERIKT
ncbi:MAG: DUF362 domain-containing protein [Synergistaceae bacterium]|jgi:uncharacterized protein (DUF362 family)|nr:DUF362 domain-containing protein [Synergistaceae bacterium]